MVDAANREHVRRHARSRVVEQANRPRKIDKDANSGDPES
jgi:hypothetical protein